MEFIKNKGDIIEMLQTNEVDAIAHGCNCFHVMGAGIAAQVKLNFPFAYDADKRTNKGDVNKLGSYSFGKGVSTGYVFNLYTQFYPGPEFNPSAFDLCLFKLANGTEKNLFKSVAFPYIGCGIGGFKDEDWIEERIKSHFEETTLKVYLVEYNG